MSVHPARPSPFRVIKNSSGEHHGLPSSLKNRTWTRSVEECGKDRCFLPWIRRSPNSPFTEFFVDYKKDFRDGYLLACPMGYTLSEAVGLDPFRMCYADPTMTTFVPGSCGRSVVSTFGDPEPAFCSPTDPCFEDHRLALRVTNVALSIDAPSHNGTMVFDEGVEFFGWSAFFSLYSDDEGRSMCTVTDGFRSFDATLRLMLPASITHDVLDSSSIAYNVTILTTCSTSLENCTGGDIDLT